MNSIVRDIDYGTRTVDGIRVRITEPVRTDHGRSFEIHRIDTGADLTEGCSDTWPSDDAGHTGLIADHVRGGDAVDGAGRSRREGRHG